MNDGYTIQFLKHYVTEAAIAVDVDINLGVAPEKKIYIPIEHLGETFEAAMLEGAPANKANFMCLESLANALTGHPGKMKALLKAKKIMNWSH